MAIRRYAAFVSYSHKDAYWGRWLHRALERFKTPSRLGSASLPPRIRPVFRDEEETAPAAELGAVITEALQASDALVVICSPDAAASKWVDKEIVEFRALGKGARIFPIIVAGQPHDAALECFPPSLREELGNVGASEPLAVDIRVHGKHDTLLKVAAALLGIPFDALKQRDKIRRNRNLAAALAASFFGLSIYAGSLLLEQRAINKQASLTLAQASINAMDYQPIDPDGRGEESSFDRAMRFAVLASRSDWLSPAAPEAEAALARVSRLSRLQQVLRGHSGEITDIAYSPNGQLLATSSADGTARLWNAASGRQIGLLQTGDLARLWRARNPPPPNTVQLGRPELYLSKVVFSPTGQDVFALVDNKAVRAWRLNGRVEATFEPEGGSNLQSFELNSAGDRLLILSEGALTIWDVHSGALLQTLRPEYDQYIQSAHFSPDGNYIVTGEGRFTHSGLDSEYRHVNRPMARVWNPRTGRELRRITGFSEGVSDALFANQGRTLITTTFDGHTTAWAWQSGRAIARLVARQGYWRLGGLSVSSDGQQVLGYEIPFPVCACIRVVGDTAFVWRLPEGDSVFDRDASGALIVDNPSELKGHQGNITSAVFSHDGGMVVTTSDDGSARLWGADGSAVAVLVGGRAGVAAAAFDPHGERVATAQGDAIARIWRVDTGSPPIAHALVRIETRLDRSASTASRWRSQLGPPAAFSNAGRLVATAPFNGVVNVDDARTRTLVRAIPTGDLDVNRVALSPEGNFVAAGSEHGAFWIWNTTTGRLVFNTHFAAPVIAIALSNNATWAGVVSDHQAVMLIHVPDGSARTFGADPAAVAALTPDGDRLAAGGENGSVIVWDTSTLRVLGHFSIGNDPVGAIGFSPDGRFVVASRVLDTLLNGDLLSFTDDRILADRQRTNRNALFVWDLEDHSFVRRLGGEHGAENTFAFSPDGALLATTGGGCTLRLWHVGSWLPIDDFHCLRSAENYPLTALVFTPTPLLRATTGDGQIREWNLGAIGRLRGERLAASVCANNLVGGEAPSIDDPHRREGIRLITQSDIDAAPILRGHLGEDVCTPSTFAARLASLFSGLR